MENFTATGSVRLSCTTSFRTRQLSLSRHVTLPSFPSLQRHLSSSVIELCALALHVYQERVFMNVNRIHDFKNNRRWWRCDVTTNQLSSHEHLQLLRYNIDKAQYTRQTLGLFHTTPIEHRVVRVLPWSRYFVDESIWIIILTNRCFENCHISELLVSTSNDMFFWILWFSKQFCR